MKKITRDLTIGISASLIATTLWTGSCYLLNNQPTPENTNEESTNTNSDGDTSANSAPQTRPVREDHFREDHWHRYHIDTNNDQYILTFPDIKLLEHGTHTYTLEGEENLRQLEDFLSRLEINERNYSTRMAIAADRLENVMYEMHRASGDDATSNVTHTDHVPTYPITRAGIDTLYNRIGGRNGTGGLEDALEGK